MPVFDQGYQHWSGTLSGHTWRWLTIARQGVRVGTKNIFLRLLIIFSWLPAAILAFILCLWGLLENKSTLITPLLPFLQGLFSREVIQDPRHYRMEVWSICFSQFLKFELYISMIVVLLVGPRLISQDLRFNALPLYFSRPLRRIDYFVGKLAYVMGLLFSLDITILWDTLPLLLACLAYGVVIILSAGGLMLGFSALTRNSRYVALFWVGLWFISGIVATILNSVETGKRQSEMYRRNAAIRQNRQFRAGPMNEEMRAQQEAANRAEEKMWTDFQEETLAASRSNWRPMLSYTGNLLRIGTVLLGTDTAWEDFSRLRRPEERTSFLLEHLGPQYPWIWSVILLTILFGLSACILNFRIRSLDRLK
jgi:ABC-2 type transport system permease protein